MLTLIRLSFSFIKSTSWIRIVRLTSSYDSVRIFMVVMGYEGLLESDWIRGLGMTSMCVSVRLFTTSVHETRTFFPRSSGLPFSVSKRKKGGPTLSTDRLVTTYGHGTVLHVLSVETREELSFIPNGWTLGCVFLKIFG